MKKANIIVPALLTIAACGGIIAGSTYALFTSESKVNIAVTSGKVDVVATISDLATYSGKANSLTGDLTADEANIVLTDEQGTFSNGGTAKIENNALILDKMTPGDKVTFKISVANNSTVASKYRTLIKEEGGTGLFEGLKFTIGESSVVGRTKWKELPANAAAEGTNVATFDCSVSLPSNAGNEYQGKNANILFSVEAVQGNVQTYVYPTGVSADSFASATNIVYTDKDGTLNGSNGKWDGDNAKFAFTKADGATVFYAADLKAAIQSGANAIYANEDATIGNGYTHLGVSSDLVIYANDVDFGASDFALGGNGTTLGNTAGDMDLKIHDAFNLRVWGYAPADGVTQKVELDNCSFVGNGRTVDNQGLFFISGNTGTLNVMLNNCYNSEVSAGVYLNTNGSVTIKNSDFKSCATGIKASHKATGNLSVDVADTTFSSCGIDADKDLNLSAWFYEDGSAIKCKTKGSMALTLNNVSIVNPIGESVFHIDDDEHDTKYTGNTTVNATNVTIDGTAYSFN